MPSKRKNRYFLIFIFLIPLMPFGVGLNLGSGIPNIDLPRVFCGLLIITFLIQEGIPVKEQNGNDSIWFKLFMLFQMLSVFVVQNLLGGIVSFIGVCLIYYAIYFITIRITFDKELMNGVLNSLKLLLLVLSIFSIVEFISGVNFFDSYRSAYIASEEARFNEELGVMRSGLKASMGPYASNLPFAYMLSSLFFVLFAPTKSKFFDSKIIKPIALVICLFGIVATQSRAAYGGLIIGLLVYFALRYRFNPFYLAAFIGVFGAGAFFIFDTFFADDFLVKYLLNINESKESDEGLLKRLADNLKDISFALESPIFGHGFGSFQYKSQVGSDIKNTLGTSDTSMYGAILIESGVFAMIAFVTLIARVLWKSLKNIINLKGKEKAFLLALFTSLLVFCFNLLSSYRFESSFILFLLLGLNISMNRIKNDLISSS